MKMKHQYLMGTLKKVKSEKEMRAWQSALVRRYRGDIPFIYEPKVDGVSLELIYTDGWLEEAITRGDGHEGEVVTRQALNITGIMHRLADEISCIIRGEVVIPNDAWEKIKAQGYSHPRNAASGALMSKEPTKIPLSFIAYYIMDDIDRCSSFSYCFLYSK